MCMHTGTHQQHKGNSLFLDLNQFDDATVFIVYFKATKQRRNTDVTTVASHEKTNEEWHGAIARGIRVGIFSCTR